MCSFDDLSEEEKTLNSMSNGLLNDILNAEILLESVKAIGKRAEELNRTRFGMLFGGFQRAFQQAFVLSISRIFDRASAKHKTVSIEALIRQLKRGARGLRIRNRRLVAHILTCMGHGDELAGVKDDVEFTNRVASIIENELKGRQPIIRKVKELRNKRIAHNELVDPEALKAPTWEEAESLLEFARNFETIVGQGYLLTCLVDAHYRWISTSSSRPFIQSLENLIKLVVEQEAKQGGISE